MTSKEFVLWLKGFTEGVHEFNVTPKQWDLLKDKLAEVTDEQAIGVPIGEGGWGTPNRFITPAEPIPCTTPNTHPFPTWQHPHYVDPYNPYRVIATPGTSNTVDSGIRFTTTPGIGSIAVSSTPFFVTTSTTTQWNPSGSWNYTYNKED